MPYQPFCIVEGKRVPGVEVMCKIEPRQLIRDGFVDGLPAVACVDAPKTRSAIEHLMPIAVFVVHAIRGHNKTRIVFELPMGRERHPETVEVFRYEVVIKD